MSGNVQVTSIEAVKDFAPTLAYMQEELKGVLSSLQIEMQRAISWIEQDRPRYWQTQLKRAFDKVTETRTALTTCQMRTIAGRHPWCIEEKVAHSLRFPRFFVFQEVGFMLPVSLSVEQ